VVTAPRRDIPEAHVGPRLTQSTRVRGPKIDDGDTRIVEVSGGFNFLDIRGRIYGNGNKTKSEPRDVRVVKHPRAMETRPDTHRQASDGRVIRDPEPVIRGRSDFDRHVYAGGIVSRVRHRRWEMLWRWAKRRPPEPSREAKVRDFRDDAHGNRTSRAGKAEPFEPEATRITRLTRDARKETPYEAGFRHRR